MEQQKKTYSTIKFKTKKQAADTLKLMKSQSEYISPYLEKVIADKLNSGYIVKFKMLGRII